MKIRTTPIISPRIEEAERDKFSFNEKKVICANGKWKPSGGVARTIAKAAHTLTVKGDLEILSQKRKLRESFSIRVRDVASPEKPKNIAAKLDSLETLSGEGNFESNNDENPIKDMLLDPSTALESELVSARNQLPKSEEHGLKEGLVLVDVSTFKNTVQKDLNFKVLKEAIHHVKSPKSLKLIMDQVNDQSMDHSLSRPQRAKLKTALVQRMAKVYGPAMDALREQQEKISSDDPKNIVAWEQLLSGYHDLMVSVTAVAPNLLNQRTVSSDNEDRSIIRQQVEHAVQNIIHEMNIKKGVSVKEHQESLQHFNALVEVLVKPVVDLSSKNPKQRMKKVLKGLGTEYKELTRKSLVDVKCYLGCKKLVQLIGKLSKNRISYLKKKDELTEKQTRINNKQLSSDVKKQLKKDISLINAGMDSLAADGLQLFATIKEQLSSLATPASPALSEMVKDLSAASKGPIKTAPAKVKQQAEAFEARLADIEKGSDSSLAFDPKKAVLRPGGDVETDSMAHEKPEAPASLLQASPKKSVQGASVVRQVSKRTSSVGGSTPKSGNRKIDKMTVRPPPPPPPAAEAPSQVSPPVGAGGASSSERSQLMKEIREGKKNLKPVDETKVGKNKKQTIGLTDDTFKLVKNQIERKRNHDSDPLEDKIIGLLKGDKCTTEVLKKAIRAEHTPETNNSITDDDIKKCADAIFKASQDRSNTGTFMSFVQTELDKLTGKEWGEE